MKKIPFLNISINALSIIAVMFLCSSDIMATDNIQSHTSDYKKQEQEIVSITTAWPVDPILAGDHIPLAIILNIKHGFHINADHGQIVSLEDFSPLPTQIRVIKALDSITIQSPFFPPAHPLKVQYADKELMFFKKQTIIYLPIKFDDTAGPGPQEIRLELTYQACNESTCFFPKKIILKQKLHIAQKGRDQAKINRETFAQYNPGSIKSGSKIINFDLFSWSFSINISSYTGLILVLLTAGFGGLLLNFTPCVLPLVPIKIISLSNAGKDNRKRSVILGLAMFSGIFTFWISLGLMIAMMSGFTAANQLFHYPFFTITIGLIIAVMALGMCGLFHTRVPAFIYMIKPDQNSITGYFAIGILTGILSTPCTAPFMGTAAAWAGTRHPLVALSVFASIGAGMAIPYLILSARPSLLKKLPKTGPGSILIKQVMGIFMFAVAAFFIGAGITSLIPESQNLPSGIYWWPVAFFCAIAGGWLTYKINKSTLKKTIKAIFIATGLIIITISVFAGFLLTKKSPINWQPYTPQLFEQAVSDKKTIAMIFTAQWCLNCKALEQTVWHDTRITKLFADKNIIPIRVDITSNNPSGKARLKQTRSLTIPLLVIYSPDGEIIFKSDFYTVKQIQQVLGRPMLKM
jgi:thiol:disulfide interchange protein